MQQLWRNMKSLVTYANPSLWRQFSELDQHPLQYMGVDPVVSIDLFAKFGVFDVVETALQHNMRLLGVVQKMSHFELESFVEKEIKEIPFFEQYDVDNKGLVWSFKNVEDNRSLTIIEGKQHSLPLSYSFKDPSYVDVVTLGSRNRFSDRVDEFVAESLKTGIPTIMFHPCTVLHSNYWLRYKAPTPEEQYSLYVAGEQSGTIIATCADSALWRLGENVWTKQLYTTLRQNGVDVGFAGASNAKAVKSLIGRQAVYIVPSPEYRGDVFAEMLDLPADVKMVPVLARALLNPENKVKEHYTNPVEWIMNTGIRQNPVAKNLR